MVGGMEYTAKELRALYCGCRYTTGMNRGYLPCRIRGYAAQHLFDHWKRYAVWTWIGNVLTIKVPS